MSRTRQRWQLVFFTGLLAATMQVRAQQAAAPMSNPLFARQVMLEGTLGKQHVSMHLQAKVDEIDSVEGAYQSDHHQNRPVLLAGEVTADKLSLEESVDGKDVSGQWDGDIQGRVIRGIWLSADGLMSKEFELKIQTEPQKINAKPAKN